MHQFACVAILRQKLFQNCNIIENTYPIIFVQND